MISEASERDAFADILNRVFVDGAFVRLTLGKVRGDDQVRRAVATMVEGKAGGRVKLVTSFKRKDVTETFSAEQAADALMSRVGAPFQSATLVTTSETVALVYSRKGRAQLTRQSHVHPVPPSADRHDREKTRLVAAEAPYLAALGVTDKSGVVKPAMAGKYRQINHFVQILDDVLRQSSLADRQAMSVIDIGSGKGYLTFALYDHLTQGLGKTVEMTGVELRADLVALCNETAQKCGYSRLAFVAGAADTTMSAHDIVIALHACDTATDDAISHGVRSKAAMIICAPCCQHELAPQIASGEGPIAGLARFGLFKQRFADLVTDAVRALLLEAAGYQVRVIEFVSTEHTAKNLMLAAVRSNNVDRDRARRELAALKALSGYQTQHLESLLAELTGAPD